MDNRFSFAAAGGDAIEPEPARPPAPRTRACQPPDADKPFLTRGNLEGPGGALARQRWTLDYPEDYAFLAALYDRLGAGAAIPGMAEIAALIESDPGIEALQRACRRPLEDIPFGRVAFSVPMEPMPCA
ncbi:MAG: hypothetical protein V3U23_05180 [Kiloniellales bacterium]